MMSLGIPREISNKYCLRFGYLAMGLGLIDEIQLNEAFRIQCHAQQGEQGVPLLPTILFDQGWMSSEQIEHVLNMVLKTSRITDVSAHDDPLDKAGIRITRSAA